MAPWHTAFNTALNNLTQQWIEVMTAAIEQGKQNGYVRGDINPNQATLFIMSGYWGIRNFGKLEHSKTVYLAYLKQLKIYLNSLK
jgi:TetR/AcrR family transcriptional repressor of nem operon